MKKIISILIFVTLLIGCKKDTSEITNGYNFPTGAIPSKFADIQHLPLIEDIDSLNLPVFEGVTSSGYIIDLMPDPELLQDDKKQIGESCVAWSICNILNYEYKIIERNNIYGNADKIFSPYYLYNQRSNNSVDNGWNFGEAIKILESQGIPKWVDMPSPGPAPFNQPPLAIATGNAGYYKQIGIRRLGRLEVNGLIGLSWIKSLIRRNRPIAFAASVDKGFESGGNNTTSFSHKPDGRNVWIANSGQSKGYHAMVICGYDNDINAFKVLNSWGPEWGNKGYIWIDYEHFCKQVVILNGQSVPEIYTTLNNRVEGTITTNTTLNITSTSATCNGNVTINAGATVLEKGICYSVDINPTTGSSLSSNISVSSGTGNGSVSANLSGLKPDTRYWVRAYAKTSKGILYGNEINFTTTTGSSGGNTVTDIDGNVYHTVQIGTQTWLVENLKTTKYRNGDPIPHLANLIQWGTTNTGAWCYYNDDTTHNAVYGKLYNGFTVKDPRELAPSGWHIPTNTEWNVLIKYLDPTADTAILLGEQSMVAGGLLKEIGTSHWIKPNIGATNSSGFTALPTGTRSEGGNFTGLYFSCQFWSSSSTSTNASIRNLSTGAASINRSNHGLRQGNPIRCIKN